MKIIQDIYKGINTPDFLNNQIAEVHWNKNVLFVNPQLNGRNFYKYLLPYVIMFEYDVWGTAITSLEKYKPNREYELVSVPMNSRQILWADYIVFPFTNQELEPLFEKIKKINPSIKIIFNVDFNFYLLSKNHPLHDTFGEDTFETIENNIFHSDITLVSNSKLCQYLIDKFKKELSENRFKGKKSKVEIGTFPYLIDKELILENVRLDTPKIENPNNQLRVGIIGTNYVWEDINSYKDMIKEVCENTKNKVKFVMIGFDGIDNKTGKNCFPSNCDVEIIKPCTIIHYYKQLKSLKLDLLFIPLRFNEFNQTSENYNKFLEAGLFKIPVMVYNTFPYNEIIKNGNNGVILTKKKEFVEKVEFFEKNRDELKRMGESAYKLVTSNFIYDKDNLPIVDRIFN